MNISRRNNQFLDWLDTLPNQVHATDDHGFPLNPNCCAQCKATSQRMNDRELSKLFDGLRFNSNPVGEINYDGDMGREVLDQGNGTSSGGM